MKTKDELKLEHIQSIRNDFNKLSLELTISERILIDSAWDIAWNLAIEQAKGNELTLEEGYPKIIK